MLEIGSMAPDLALQDSAGRPVRLADYRGKQNVLLFFMRSTSCPICNRHVRDLARRAADLDADGVQVLIAVPEDSKTASAWQAKHSVPFPVVTGRTGSPHEAVGLARRVFGSVQQSGSVLIDMHGVVRHAHGATMPAGSYDKTGIAAAIEALRVPAAG